ncbi:flagellar biosynthesis protein FlhF [Acanthopleuribacter pedis]|uniref:Flagellar biosynthesis protein FlhF n=1 Tax=Acanthopleuribacter pedis TaxID=442870 RepID=A0A8J7QRK3_9BACT|nr:flagellar biosynthesis protein FlhF [Acanthopleuribacter pedis]MBO1322930.1 flagellar biosynthesis protein FlhF [Acanthopleuribacter pedis]
MKIKKFEAPSMKEALEKIKEEMGPDAFILGTKSIKKKGPLGFGDRNFLQVTAAVDVSDPNSLASAAAAANAAAPAPGGNAPGGGRIDIRQGSESAFGKDKSPASENSPLSEGLADAAFPKIPTYTAGGTTVLPDDLSLGADSPPASPFSQGFEAIYGDALRKAKASESGQKSREGKDGRSLREEVAEVREMLAGLSEKETDLTPLHREMQDLKGLLYSVIRNQSPIAGLKLSPAMITQYQRMKDSGVEDNIAAKLIKMAHDKMKPDHRDNSKRIQAFLRSLFAGLIDVADPKLVDPARPRVMALVGPTGVGKTTTLAKLAAYAHLQAGSEVVLITLDTYRIAAVEQLKTYAKIMEIPVQVALNSSELRHAIQFHQDKALILIDTAGHSQRDEIGMDNLMQFFGNQEDIEVHLVLSATTKSADLNDIVTRFAPLQPDYLLFTKLDETSQYGSLFTQMIKASRPVSFVTTGQNVPEDFEFAGKDLLASLFSGYTLAQAKGSQN